MPRKLKLARNDGGMQGIEDGIAIYCLRRNTKEKDKNANANQIKIQNTKYKDKRCGYNWM